MGCKVLLESVLFLSVNVVAFDVGVLSTFGQSASSEIMCNITQFVRNKS